VYNEAINNETITLLFLSENSTTTSGPDYYSKAFKLNFSGWNLMQFNKSAFGISRSPLGWNNITGISLR
jgi:hypothetical protein